MKKYSIDLTIFSSSDNQNESDCDISGRQNRKMRKMTHDLLICTERSRNPLEKDPLFQKMNEEGVINQIELDNLI